jgi:hypothetical protein
MSADDAPASGVPQADEANPLFGYVPPRLVIIGTVAEITRGANPGGTDGIFAGSTV